MRSVSFGKLLPLLPVVVWVFCLTLFGFVGADWYWRFVAPQTEHASYLSPADPAVVGHEIVQRHLFGVLLQEVSGSVAAQQFRLIGLVTHFDSGPGFAILQANGETESIAAIVGEEFMPGVILTGITERAVEISQGGTQTILKLEDEKVVESSAPLPREIP